MVAEHAGRGESGQSNIPRAGESERVFGGGNLGRRGRDFQGGRDARRSAGWSRGEGETLRGGTCALSTYRVLGALRRPSLRGGPLLRFYSEGICQDVASDRTERGPRRPIVRSWRIWQPNVFGAVPEQFGIGRPMSPRACSVPLRFGVRFCSVLFGILFGTARPPRPGRCGTVVMTLCEADADVLA